MPQGMLRVLASTWCVSAALLLGCGASAGGGGGFNFDDGGAGMSGNWVSEALIRFIRDMARGPFGKRW